MTRRRDRGASNVGCVVGLLVLVVMVVVLMKAVPVKVAVAELKDYAVKQAESASLPRHDDQHIRGQLLLKAQQLKVPLGEEQLKVSRDSVQVRVEYTFTVPIYFPFYTYDWHVEEHIERVLF